MATYHTSHPGNLAMQEEVWTLTLPEAAQAVFVLGDTLGSYWHTVLAKPYRRAKRAKATAVRIITAGFSTSELSNALYAMGATVARQDA